MNTPEYTHTDPAALLTLAAVAWLIYGLDTLRRRYKARTPRPPIGTHTRKGNPPR